MRLIVPVLALVLASACTRAQQPIEMPTPRHPKRTPPSDSPLLSPWSLALALPTGLDRPHSAPLTPTAFAPRTALPPLAGTALRVDRLPAVRS